MLLVAMLGNNDKTVLGRYCQKYTGIKRASVTAQVKKQDGSYVVDREGAAQRQMWSSGPFANDGGSTGFIPLKKHFEHWCNRIDGSF